MRRLGSRVLSGFAAMAVGGVFVAASAIGALADSPSPATVDMSVSGQTITVSGSLYWGSGCSDTKAAKAGYGVVWNDTGDKGLPAPGDATQLVGLTGSPAGESDSNLVHTNGVACNNGVMTYGPLAHTYQNWPPSPLQVCVIAYDYRPGQTSPAFHSIYEGNGNGQLGNTDNSILETPSGGVPKVCKTVPAPLKTDVALTNQGPGNVDPGQNITYTIKVQNLSTAGTATSHSQVLVDTLDANVQFVSASGGIGWGACSYDSNSRQITCTYTPNLGIGQPAPDVTVVVKAPSGGNVNSVVNTATVYNGRNPDNPDDANVNNQTGSVTTLINQLPANLTLTKSASPASGTIVHRGDQIDYALHYANTGGTRANNVTITDAIPAGTSFKVGSASCTTTCTPNYSLATDTVSYTLDIPAGVSGDAKFSVIVDANAADGMDIDNVAQLTYDNIPPVTSNHTHHTVKVPVVGLTLTKSANPTTGSIVHRGDQIDYTLHYANTGASDANNVTITDAIPAGTAFKTGSASCTTTCTPSYSVATDTVSFALNIPAGVSGDAKFSVTVNANAADGFDIDNVAMLTYDNIPPVTSNHTHHTVKVPPATAPDVTITNQGTPAGVTVGDLITYHVVVSNLPGATKATSFNQLLVDTLDPNVQFVSASGGAGWSACTFDSSTRKVSCTYTPALNPGGLAPEVTIVVRSLAAGNVVNTAHVDNGVGNPDDANPNNQTASVTTPVTGIPIPNPPSIVVDKSATPQVNVGQQITYSVTVTNKGGSPTNSSITVTDSLPTGVQYVSASGVNWVCLGTQDLTCTWLGAALPVNGSTTAITILATATQDAVPSVTNTAFAHMGSQTVQDSATTTVKTPVNLTLSKSADPASGSDVSRGEQIDYTLHYANTGTLDANGVVITDVIPNGTTFVAGSASCTTTCTTSFSGNTVTFTLDVLAGTAGTAMFSVTVDSDAVDGQIIDNVAKITFNGNDTPSNHTKHQVFVQGGNLTLSKGVTPAKATVGTVLTYTLTAEATGTDQTAVVVTDAIPDGTTYQSGSATCAGPSACTGVYDAASNVITWSLGTLPAGTFATMTFQVKVNGPAADGTLPTAIANIGSITSNETPQKPSNRVVVPVTFVLGEKVVKTPTTTPGTPLPFTGFDVVQNALLALVCIGAGLVLLTWPRLRQNRRMA